MVTPLLNVSSHLTLGACSGSSSSNTRGPPLPCCQGRRPCTARLVRALQRTQLQVAGPAAAAMREPLAAAAAAAAAVCGSRHLQRTRLPVLTPTPNPLI